MLVITFLSSLQNIKERNTIVSDIKGEWPQVSGDRKM
jgi:hypothetical protein